MCAWRMDGAWWGDEVAARVCVGVVSTHLLFELASVVTRQAICLTSIDHSSWLLFYVLMLSSGPMARSGHPHLHQAVQEVEMSGHEGRGHAERSAWSSRAFGHLIGQGSDHS